MKKFSRVFVGLVLLGIVSQPNTSIFSIDVRLKDIARIDGSREDQVTGFGLVVGLNGTGDTRSAFTSEAMKNYLSNLGVDVKAKGFETRNTASVLVSANVSNSVRVGDKIDVLVSSLGDARSLEGGVLLQTNLKAANGETVVVASGVLSFGGKDQNRYAERRTGKNTGVSLGGGIVEREYKPFDKESNLVTLTLRDRDYSLLASIATEIESGLGIKGKIISATEISLEVPENSSKTQVLSNLENLNVSYEPSAKVVINERNGTVVMGGSISVSEVAISKQGLSLQVGSNNRLRRLGFLVDDEKDPKVFLMKQTAKISDIVDALNKVGASTKDIISILQGLKKAGVLNAEVIIQ